jgi:hypothetical protein
MVITVIAYGCLIEKFDLFVQAMASQTPPWKRVPDSQKFANADGRACTVIDLAA